MKKNYKLIIHLVFWFYWLNQLLFPFYTNKTEKYYWHDIALELGLAIINFYLIYLLIPLFIKNKKKWIAILPGIVILFLMVIFRYYSNIVFWKHIMDSPKDMMAYSNQWLLYASIRLTVIIGIYAILIKFVIDWFDAQKLKAELVTQNKASELALLRSQVNPHFLFNTLNNIYSLVYKKSDEAPAAVMKLSSIMRYMLYDATTDKVPLEKEIEYLQSFIELQKLRLKDQDFIELSITGSPDGKTIAPMLLVPFVENAFKHGSKTVPPPGIIIRLTITPRQILFEVKNSIRSETIIQKDASAGIGLHNIQRRLDLLYPDKHSLLITEDKDLFNVKLIIEN